MSLDGLDRRIGGDLHVRGTEQGRAGVAARDGHDGRHHQVLDEGAADDDLALKVLALRDLVGKTIVSAHRALHTVGAGRRRGGTLGVG